MRAARSDALLIRARYVTVSALKPRWVPALRRVTLCRAASGTRVPAFFKVIAVWHFLINLQGAPTFCGLPTGSLLRFAFRKVLLGLRQRRDRPCTRSLTASAICIPLPQKIFPTTINRHTSVTMNGGRAALALAQCGLAHRFHRPALQKEDQRKPDFFRNNSPHGCVARDACIDIPSISEAHGVVISVERRALRDAAAFGGALLSAGQGEATL
jgi:hypothetical protein